MVKTTALFKTDPRLVAFLPSHDLYISSIFIASIYTEFPGFPESIISVTSSGKWEVSLCEIDVQMRRTRAYGMK